MLCASLLGFRYLAHGADKLAGQDLRTVTPKDVARILSSWNTAEQKRIAALKALCLFQVKKELWTLRRILLAP